MKLLLTHDSVRWTAHILSLLEQQINATPTSEARNHLCDAQIHLNEALSLLEKQENRHEKAL